MKVRYARYDLGGIATIAQPFVNMAGNMVQQGAYNSTGVNNNQYIFGSALKGAGQGALAGAALGPWGALAGGLIGGTVGLFSGKKQAKNIDEQTAAAQAEQERIAAEQAAKQAEIQKQMEEFKKLQQDNYNKAYYAAAPKRDGSLFAKKGGVIPLASDVNLLEGNSHEQGGIKLAHGGNIVAEVEGGEVMKNNRVYSDTLKIGDKTYAEHAEKLGKKKGKAEILNASTDFREKNSGERMGKRYEDELNNLFLQQELSKMKSKYAQPKKMFDGGAIMGVAQNLVPFADNIYNSFLINKTPTIPAPAGYTNRQFVAQKAMPMKTNYNINPQLAEMQRQFGTLKRDVDQNTASSNVGRAEKMKAFANVLSAKNNLYGTKENIETQLANQNNMNIQQVDNMNAMRNQDVINTNIGLADDYKNRLYNWELQKMGREDKILRDKSMNFADATQDAMTLIKDANKKNLDISRITTDFLKYNDAAGLSRLLDSDILDGFMDSTKYADMLSQLESAGQTEAANKLKSKYGKKYGK